MTFLHYDAQYYYKERFSSYRSVGVVTTAVKLKSLKLARNMKTMTETRIYAYFFVAKFLINHPFVNERIHVGR